jgi:hypothetical protein
MGRGTQGFFQWRAVDEGVHEAGLALDLEQCVKLSVPDIAIHEQRPHVRLGEAEGQIGCHKGLALSFPGAGDHQNYLRIWRERFGDAKPDRLERFYDSGRHHRVGRT